MAGHILNGLLPLSSTWNTNLHLWKWRLRVLSWKNRFYILCFLCTSDITNIWQFSNFSVSFLKSASRYNRNFENFYFVPVVYKNYHYVIQVFLCLSAPPSLPSISLPLLLSLSLFLCCLSCLSVYFSLVGYDDIVIPNSTVTRSHKKRPTSQYFDERKKIGNCINDDHNLDQ